MTRVGHKHLISEGIPTRREKKQPGPLTASTKIKIDTLELVIGKLNHEAHVIPPTRYFLNRIRHLPKRGKKWGMQRLQLWNRLDLQVWMKLL